MEYNRVQAVHHILDKPVRLKNLPRSKNEIKILKFLRKRKTGVTVAQIAKHIDATNESAGNQMRLLFKKGLVDRQKVAIAKGSKNYHHLYIIDIKA